MPPHDTSTSYPSQTIRQMRFTQFHTKDLIAATATFALAAGLYPFYPKLSLIVTVLLTGFWIGLLALVYCNYSSAKSDGKLGFINLVTTNFCRIVVYSCGVLGPIYVGFEIAAIVADRIENPPNYIVEHLEDGHMRYPDGLLASWHADTENEILHLRLTNRTYSTIAIRMNPDAYEGRVYLCSDDGLTRETFVERNIQQSRMIALWFNQMHNINQRSSHDWSIPFADLVVGGQFPPTTTFAETIENSKIEYVLGF